MADVSEFDAARIRAIMQKRTLTKRDLEEVTIRGRMGGKFPDATGWDSDGQPYWSNEDVTKWLRNDAVHIRSRLAPPIQHRTATIGRRPMTWDETTLSVEAVIATEARALVFSPDEGEVVEEILIAEGVVVEGADLPLLDNHDGSTLSTIGRVQDVRAEGDEVHAVLLFSEREADIIDRVRDGTLTSVSVGYVPLSRVVIPPGESAVVAGQLRTAGEKSLHVVTEWRLHEVSVVSVPADPFARIRSSEFGREGRNMSVAIHSRQSQTGRMSTRQIVSAIAQREGIDTSRFAGQIVNGVVVPVQEAQRVRDAEVAHAFRHRSGLMLFAELLEADGDSVRDYSPYGLAKAAWQLMQSRAGDGIGNLNLIQAYDGLMATILVAARGAADDSLRLVIDEGELPNYLQWPSYRLGAVELEAVPKGGAAESIDFQVTEESVQVARYGTVVKIDEMDLVNFLSSGVTLLPQTLVQPLAQAAIALESNLPWALLLTGDGPTMEDGLTLWHANHGNLTTGDVDDGTLGEMAGMIGKQTENGVNLNLRGEVLAVAVDNERAARKLVRDVDLAGSRSTPTMAVVSDARIDNGLKDPQTKAPIAGQPDNLFMFSTTPGYGLQRQFLAGAREPQVRVGLLTDDPGQFGLFVEVKHTVGVAALSWKGMCKAVPNES